MREIKFRAWNSKDKHMFQIARFDLADYTVYSHLFACEGYLGESLKIMQYTGLHDKRGIDIYEGDVIAWLDIPIGEEQGQMLTDVVIFENGCFRTKKYKELISNLITGSNGFMNSRGEYYFLKKHETEVIGNIYEVEESQ